eukprot:TRINITY_DN3696_c1_g2_i1.p2 TRINITY_DN3696_c1_g2~~TRINITY_DN3696_c1_g2_i1.p2  ORF type:complete len:243 (-),score=41.93 TRINITY_DN3696_c1_g2_i1:39-767(-)
MNHNYIISNEKKFNLYYYNNIKNYAQKFPHLNQRVIAIDLPRPAANPLVPSGVFAILTYTSAESPRLANIGLLTGADSGEAFADTCELNALELYEIQLAESDFCAKFLRSSCGGETLPADATALISGVAAAQAAQSLRPCYLQFRACTLQNPAGTVVQGEGGLEALLFQFNPCTAPCPWLTPTPALTPAANRVLQQNPKHSTSLQTRCVQKQNCCVGKDAVCFRLAAKKLEEEDCLRSRRES